MIFVTKKYKNLRIVIDPKGTVLAEGRRIVTGLLGLSKVGLSVEFIDGHFETDDEKIIDLLKKNDDYGISFVAVEKDEEGKQIEPTLKGSQKKKVQEREKLAKEAADTNPQDED